MRILKITDVSELYTRDIIVHQYIAPGGGKKRGGVVPRLHSTRYLLAYSLTIWTESVPLMGVPSVVCPVMVAYVNSPSTSNMLGSIVET